MRRNITFIDTSKISVLIGSSNSKSHLNKTLRNEKNLRGTDGRGGLVRLPHDLEVVGSIPAVTSSFSADTLNYFKLNQLKLHS